MSVTFLSFIRSILLVSSRGKWYIYWMIFQWKKFCLRWLKLFSDINGQISVLRRFNNFFSFPPKSFVIDRCLRFSLIRSDTSRAGRKRWLPTRYRLSWCRWQHFPFDWIIPHKVSISHCKLYAWLVNIYQHINPRSLSSALQFNQKKFSRQWINKTREGRCWKPKPKPPSTSNVFD